VLDCWLFFVSCGFGFIFVFIFLSVFYRSFAGFFFSRCLFWVFGWATYVYFEAFRAFLVYLEAHCAFLLYTTLLIKKKKKKKDANLSDHGSLLSSKRIGERAAFVTTCGSSSSYCGGRGGCGFHGGHGS
jgi:hypothetical protein